MRIIHELNKADKDEVNKKLYEYNLAHFAEEFHGRYKEVNIFVKDEEDTVRGGIIGALCWNWLEIHMLHVDEDLRKQGYGSKLLAEVEKVAREKECDFIKVDTLSFQALDFYKKYGFEVYGALENVGREHVHYYLKKDL
ncbi:GNAT family N-acetyltransferase [Priestia taiwanensis]|uniref:N-acetyltransferase n=1 Tax=Priestia taiwanensis TaxID=1347902 RepID=A0A917AKD5_9BACI|nr:GNAT family N-acetyltransferase [Priestia taiwanensis]MBM7361626.1 ribosomal protein S18 acetylase RimI-like enzyme [Priestia taiwanensis]GGE55632.1 N-acetyltransferase [Priestia taiwanensis]